MLNRVRLTLLLLLSASCGFAQINKANSLFNNYEYINAIPLYKKIVKRDSNIEALQRLADCYRILKKYQEAEEVYQKVVQKKGIDPLNFFYYGVMLKNNNKPTQAREQFVKYSLLVPSDKNSTVSIRSVDDIKLWLTRPPHFEIQNVKELNTKTAEFCPVYYNNKIVFTAERSTDLLNFEVNSLNQQAYLDIYYSNFTEESGQIKYSKQRPFPSSVNSDYHDGPISFDNNGTLYLTRVYNYSKGANFVNRPKILIATTKKKTKSDNDWDKLKDFTYNSDNYIVEHPSVSADGNVLYFASDMPGTFGGKDIWVCRKTGDAWSKPENLGEEVNTTGNELFPYIRKDGSLYFSSDGQSGFGGLDIFSATFENNKWTKVSNLGLPLNSPTDDFGIAFSDDMQKGYFSSDRPGGVGSDDIYSFIVASKSIDVSGKILMSQQLDDPAKNIKVFLLTEDGTVVNFTTSDSLGFFKFENLSPDIKYLVKMDESDPILKSRKKLYLADNENKIVRVTVINDKGNKFVFQSLPSNRSDASVQDEGNDGLSTLAGSIQFGENNKPLVNAKIDLEDERGAVLKSTITNSVGAFVFTDLVSGKTYSVKLDENEAQVPPHTKINVLNKKGEVIASVITADKGFRFELLPADQAKLTLSHEEDVKLRMSMSGKLLAANGTNKPLANVKVNLVNERGEVLQTVETDANGNFTFSKLPADRNYLVKVDEDDPRLVNMPKILLADEKGKVIGEMNNSKEGFRYEYLSADNSSLSLMSVDDTYLKFSMKGKITNGDGSGKPAANTKVNLLNEKGEVVGTGYTDEQGNFSFTKLPADQNFYVSIDEKDAKLANMKKLLIADESGKTIGEVKKDQQGNFKFEMLAADSRSHSLIAVEETELKTDMLGKLLSTDGSGKGMANKKVTLVNENGEVIDSTTTDANGSFTFKNLPSDKKYLVKLDEEDVALSGKLKLVLTDASGNNMQEIQSNKDGSFQYELLSADKKIFNLNDTEGSTRLSLKGHFLAGDSIKTEALANSIVSLYSDKGKLLQTAFTDKSGYFYFLNLPPDVKFVVKMDERDPKLLAALRLVLTDEEGVTVREMKGVKGRFKFGLLPSDIKSLSDEVVDDSWNKLKLLGKKLLSQTEKPGTALPKSDVASPKLPYGYGLFENLYFESDKYKLSDQDKKELMKVVAFIKQTPGTLIELDGHADSEGGAKHNLFLSDHRAQAAKNFLVAKGVNVNRLKGVAFGKKQLARPCVGPGPCTEEENAASRRVEIRVIYKKKKGHSL
jgi:outer membrane protein OmpA-like peptidoglycan-associated protein